MLIRFFIYGALGWCGEIIWTAVTRRISGQADNWLLMGETSLWSFPLYGLTTFLFEPLHDAIRDQFWLLRAGGYLIGFWVVEYIGGWMILKITGKMPWDYVRSPGGSLNGLIRWNFVFVWPVAGLVLEIVHDSLVRLTPAFVQVLR